MIDIGMMLLKRHRLPGNLKHEIWNLFIRHHNPKNKINQGACAEENKCH